MLDTQKITQIATAEAGKNFASASLERVITETGTDSEGKELLRIILILKPESVKNVTGNQTLDVLVGIQQKLQAEGEERFPIVEYATEQELVIEQDQE